MDSRSTSNHSAPNQHSQLSLADPRLHRYEKQIQSTHPETETFQLDQHGRRNIWQHLGQAPMPSHQHALHEHRRYSDSYDRGKEPRWHKPSHRNTYPAYPNTFSDDWSQDPAGVAPFRVGAYTDLRSSGRDITTSIPSSLNIGPVRPGTFEAYSSSPIYALSPFLDPLLINESRPQPTSPSAQGSTTTIQAPLSSTLDAPSMSFESRDSTYTSTEQALAGIGGQYPRDESTVQHEDSRRRKLQVQKPTRKNTLGRKKRAVKACLSCK